MEMEKRVPLSTLQSDHLAASWLEEGQRNRSVGIAVWGQESLKDVKR